MWIGNHNIPIFVLLRHIAFLTESQVFVHAFSKYLIIDQTMTKNHGKYQSFKKWRIQISSTTCHAASQSWSCKTSKSTYSKIGQIKKQGM